MRGAGLTVLVSGVFHAAYGEVLPEFEREAGVTVRSELCPSLGHSPQSVGSRLSRGEEADVLIMAGRGMDAIVAQKRSGGRGPAHRSHLAGRHRHPGRLGCGTCGVAPGHRSRAAVISVPSAVRVWLAAGQADPYAGATTSTIPADTRG